MKNFQVEHKKGENLSVLKKGRKYFDIYEKDMDIIRYLFCTKKYKQSKEELTDNDYKECHICGKNLYELTDDTRYDKIDDIIYQTKRHMVFISKGGKEFFTCYKVNSCFSRANKSIEIEKPADYNENVVEGLSPKNFVKTDKFNDEYLNALSEQINKKLIPFLKNWMYTKIHKKNVLKFTTELIKIRKDFVDLYFKSEEKRKEVINKIHRILGIKV